MKLRPLLIPDAENTYWLKAYSRALGPEPSLQHRVAKTHELLSKKYLKQRTFHPLLCQAVVCEKLCRLRAVFGVVHALAIYCVHTMRFPVSGLRRSAEISADLRFSTFQKALSASCLGDGRHLTRASSRSELFKRGVQDRIFLPIAVIEMPPLEWVDEKSFAFHHTTQ